MGPGAALYLREVRLAEASAHFLFEGTREVLLSHLAAETAESALDKAQVSKFFAEVHRVLSSENCGTTNLLNGDFSVFHLDDYAAVKLAHDLHRKNVLR
jgi:hypothetical protein